MKLINLLELKGCRNPPDFPKAQPKVILVWMTKPILSLYYDLQCLKVLLIVWFGTCAWFNES